MTEVLLLIESKYFAGAAVAGFLLALFFSHGSLMAALGALALIAGIGWAVRVSSRRYLRGGQDD